jgi:hypothetical protein
MEEFTLRLKLTEEENREMKVYASYSVCVSHLTGTRLFPVDICFQAGKVLLRERQGCSAKLRLNGDLKIGNQ